MASLILQKIKGKVHIKLPHKNGGHCQPIKKEWQDNIRQLSGGQNYKFVRSKI